MAGSVGSSSRARCSSGLASAGSLRFDVHLGDRLQQPCVRRADFRGATRGGDTLHAPAQLHQHLRLLQQQFGLLAVMLDRRVHDLQRPRQVWPGFRNGAGEHRRPGVRRQRQQALAQLVGLIDAACLDQVVGRVDGAVERARRRRGCRRFHGCRLGQVCKERWASALGATGLCVDHRQHRVDLGGEALPFGRIRCRDRVARERQRLRQDAVPREVIGCTQAAYFGCRIGHERLVVRHRPGTGRQLLEVVEQQPGRGVPLRRDDFVQRLAEQVTPPGHQQQRPRQARPAGQVRVGAEPA